MTADLHNELGTASSEVNKSPKRGGFGALDKESRCEIAAKGGKSVKPENRSFSKDHDLAVRAGKMGGKARQAKRIKT
jgi:hypothetical protein